MTEAVSGSHDSARLLSRVEAAKYVEQVWSVPCKPKTLAKLAVVGGGPLYRLAHHRYARYAVADLDEWARSRLGPKQRSTSELVR